MSKAYSLMEAYYQVYSESEQLDEVSSQTAMRASKEADRKAGMMAHNGDHNGSSKKRKQAVNLYQKALQRSAKKSEMNEGHDNYDLVMDYLLDEGYADTESDAEVIMANMSEEWLESILDEELTGWRKDYAIKRAEELRDRSRSAGDIAKRRSGGRHGIADKMDKRAASLIRVATKDIGGKWEANPTKRGGSGIKGEPKDMDDGVDKSRSNKTDKQLMKSKLRKRAIKSIREDYDNYDLIMAYLLDEGYADTEGDAEVIMANMSEEWLETIIEGIADKKTHPEQRATLRNKRYGFKILNPESPSASRARRKDHRERRGMRGNIGGEGGSEPRYQDNYTSEYPSFRVRGQGLA